MFTLNLLNMNVLKKVGLVNFIGGCMPDLTLLCNRLIFTTIHHFNHIVTEGGNMFLAGCVKNYENYSVKFLHVHDLPALERTQFSEYKRKILCNADGIR